MQVKALTRIERSFETEIDQATLTDENHGAVLPLQPFILHPIKLTYDEEGIEHCIPADHRLYAVRFTLLHEGSYFLEIKLNNGESFRETFSANGFCDDGFIQVSKQDARYFEFSDGKPFFPIGINLAFPRAVPVSDHREFGKKNEIAFMGMRQYERWFKRCAECGVNMARIWLGHEYFSPDTNEANVFRYTQFSKIDMLINLARKYRIKLKLTLDQFRYFRYDTEKKDNISRYFNKNLTLNGTRCESIGEWLSQPEWKNAWLNKVREFAKRYAGDTTIFAIELWNEMNCLGGVDEWSREMLPAVKTLFPNHMVVNSLGSLDNQYALNNYMTFPWKNCDFKQLHRYLDQGAIFEEVHNDPIEVIQSGMKLIEEENTPLLVAETGAVNNNHSGEFKYYSCDDKGMIFVDCVYTPVFLCSAGCGNIWHWDERYVESKNLYQYFKPLVSLVTDVNFINEHFKPLDLSDEQAYLFILQGATVCLGFIRNKADSWKNVLRDMRETKHIQKIMTSLPCNNVTQYPIWEEDTTEVLSEDGRLSFANVLYGTLFKFYL